MNKKDDAQLQREVLSELRWDSLIGGTETGVAVTDGVVTLTGTVTNYAKKLAAQAAAHRVSGVLDVANDIEVKLLDDESRTDTEIARALRSALEWDVLVPDQNIESTVSNGWVTLAGSVNSLRERDDAERAVWHLAGVRTVYNQLTVSAAKADTDELRTDIEEALERRADRAAERIRVEVSDGTVNLWGRVHSWQEKSAVIGSISHAPGVRAVNDHLRIDPYF